MEPTHAADNAISPRRKRAASSIAFAVLIFVSGAASGWAVGFNWQPKDREKSFGPEQSQADRITAYLEEYLALTPEQTENIHGILDRHTVQFRAIHETISPQLKSQMDALRDEVAGCLDEDQRLLWHEKVEKVRKRYQSHF
jgi:hypothetical protein